MNTSLFSNMFKSLFGEQITPTASQFVPITASDGTPAGISSMANLMSLLGVRQGSVTISPSSSWSLPVRGIYYLRTNATSDDSALVITANSGIVTIHNGSNSGLYFEGGEVKTTSGSNIEVRYTCIAMLTS